MEIFIVIVWASNILASHKIYVRTNPRLSQPHLVLSRFLAKIKLCYVRFEQICSGHPPMEGKSSALAMAALNGNIDDGERISIS